MKRWHIAAVVIAVCAASAAGGYWLGFRDAWTLGVAADRLPRGAAAVAHLRTIQAGSTENLKAALEFDVDSGLVWGYEVLGHPMRPLWSSLWGFDVGPELDRFAVRLADHRKDHRSPLLALKPQDAESAEHERRVNAMLERYATNR
jgi:hypothetical protein